MKKRWMLVGALLAVAVGYSVYSYRTSPYFGAPELQEGDFLLAFRGASGLRGVMRGMPDFRSDRRYFSYDAKGVPSWYLDSWSICRMPTESEGDRFAAAVEVGPGGRLEAVCEIDADGDVFVRGWILTVPKV